MDQVPQAHHENDSPWLSRVTAGICQVPAHLLDFGLVLCENRIHELVGNSLRGCGLLGARLCLVFIIVWKNLGSGASPASRREIAFVVPSRADTIAGADAVSCSSSALVTHGRSAFTIVTGPRSTANAPATASPWPPGPSTTCASPAISLTAAVTSESIANASLGSASLVLPPMRYGMTYVATQQD